MVKTCFLTLCALFVTLALVGCGKNDVLENKVFSVNDLGNKRVGVIKGTTAEAYASNFGGDSAKMQLQSFSTLSEMVEALEQGSLDAALSDDVPAKVVASKDPSIQILDESFMEESYAGVVAKENLGLLDSVNLALIQLRAMGVYDSIFASYVGGNKKYRVKQESVKGPVLKVATCAKFPPFIFYDDKKQMMGIDVEIIRYVAKHLERPVEIIDMDFENIIGAVRDGKVDLGFSALSVSEERRQIINFTDYYATSRIIVVVRSGQEKSFFSRIKEMLFGY